MLNDYRITEAIKRKEKDGYITGYAATWIREPDSYGDVIAKGAFAECIRDLEKNHEVIPLLFNHDSSDLSAYIGIVTYLKEDNRGLYFEAVFDDNPTAQKARRLALDGRLSKFSFSYDVLDQESIRLPDGRMANELRELNIYEISLVLYPANRDTNVVSVKKTEADKLSEKAERLLKEADEILSRVH